MKPFIYLHGYAVPFDQPEHRSGRLEFFNRGAFDDQLAAGGGDVFLNFAEHENEPIARPLTLFADDYGVGFSIAISAQHWRSIGRGVTNDCQYCSIFSDDEESQFERLPDGTLAYRITRARIVHVTLCADPVYAGTGVWPSEITGKMPLRLRKLWARWGVGWRQWQRGGRGVSAWRLPHALASTMAARAAQFQNFMGDMGGIIAARGVGAVPVFGHAAFSRAAGFDRSEFSAMIAASARPMARATASKDSSPDYWSPDAQRRRWRTGKYATRGSLSQ